MLINKIVDKVYYKNITLKPFTHIIPPISSSLHCMLILLLVQVFMLLITKSFSSIFIIFASILGCVAAEGVFNFLHRQFRSSYADTFVQAIIIGLLLPSTYPPLAVFVISLFCMLFTKYVFGGFASCWANPVAVVVIVSYIINIQGFSSGNFNIEDWQSRTPALELLQNGSVRILKADSAITSFLNKSIFNAVGISIPDGYISFLWDNGSLIPAFRFNIITLFSSIILISFDMLEPGIPFVFIFCYSILVKYIGPVFTGAPMFQGDIILALFTSGTLFSTLYVLQWYGTTPVSTSGKIFYGFIASVIAFFVMGLGLSSVGYMFVVISVNIISLLIQILEGRNVKKKIETYLIPRLKAMREVENV